MIKKDFTVQLLHHHLGMLIRTNCNAMRNEKCDIGQWHIYSLDSLHINFVYFLSIMTTYGWKFQSVVLLGKSKLILASHIDTSVYQCNATRHVIAGYHFRNLLGNLHINFLHCVPSCKQMVHTFSYISVVLLEKIEVVYLLTGLWLHPT